MSHAQIKSIFIYFTSYQSVFFKNSQTCFKLGGGGQGNLLTDIFYSQFSFTDGLCNFTQTISIQLRNCHHFTKTWKAFKYFLSDKSILFLHVMSHFEISAIQNLTLISIESNINCSPFDSNINTLSFKTAWCCVLYWVFHWSSEWYTVIQEFPHFIPFHLSKLTFKFSNQCNITDYHSI